LFGGGGSSGSSLMSKPAMHLLGFAMVTIITRSSARSEPLG